MTTTAAPPADTAGVSRPCNRCKEHEGTIDLRGAETVCKSCFAYYVSSKAIKRLEALQRDTAAPRPKGQRRPQRYLVGLSCGPSSTALLHVLTENVRQQRARGQKTSRFEYVAVHVVDDTVPPHSYSSSSSPSSAGQGVADQQPFLAAYRARFPDAQLQVVPLSSALELSSIDWSSLPTPVPPSPSTPTPSPTPAHRLSQILSLLPSATSRADTRRLLVRHVLAAAATARGCDALLLGHSTTSLAELTLAETAKGRGFSVPGLVNDGVVAVPRSLGDGGIGDSANAEDADTDTNTNTNTNTNITTPLPIYSPLRELFRKELVSYLAHASPPLTPLLPPSEAHKISSNTKEGGGGAVVSHRDLSIDDVLARYFADVEASYPSVVANVVRTTGKLRKSGGDGDNGVDGSGSSGGEQQGSRQNTWCGLCGAGLDELGDERWRGEIGDEDGEGAERKGERKLCYGCERSIRG